jgi:hypothetical protein
MINNLLASRAAKMAALAAATAAAFTIGIGPASADNSPPQACGNTQPGPCSETDHFTSDNALQTPIGTPSGATNCASWIYNDYVLTTFAGNGVEHVTVNKAQDFWFTTTFTGDGTAVFYPPSSVANLAFDDQGDVVSYDIVGPADATVTGHITEWFGASGNNKNAVFHGTVSVEGTDQSGNPFAIHSTQHQNWTGQQIAFVDDPHNEFADLNC